MLSFGSTLDHDPAVQVSLLLLNRIDATLRRLVRQCDRTSEIVTLRNFLAFVYDATKLLQTIEPQSVSQIVDQPKLEVELFPPSVRRYVPTEDEIAAKCAEIRAARV